MVLSFENSPTLGTKKRDLPVFGSTKFIIGTGGDKFCSQVKRLPRTFFKQFGDFFFKLTLNIFKHLLVVTLYSVPRIVLMNR
jgi:hypothetical protein